jgi:predicted Rossmann-fold nucleotide-binding protein
LITSPIIIVNLNNYFDPLLKMLERSIEEKFMSDDHKLLWHVTNDIEDTIEYLNELFPKQLLNYKRLYIDAYMPKSCIKA